MQTKAELLIEKGRLLERLSMLDKRISAFPAGRKPQAPRPVARKRGRPFGAKTKVSDIPSSGAV